jgi:hypothetical protein
MVDDKTLENKPESIGRIGIRTLEWLKDGENDSREQKIKSRKQKANKREQWACIATKATVLRRP